MLDDMMCCLAGVQGDTLLKAVFLLKFTDGYLEKIIAVEKVTYEEMWSFCE